MSINKHFSDFFGGGVGGGGREGISSVLSGETKAYCRKAK